MLIGDACCGRVQPPKQKSLKRRLEELRQRLGPPVLNPRPRPSLDASAGSRPLKRLKSLRRRLSLPELTQYDTYSDAPRASAQTTLSSGGGMRDTNFHLAHRPDKQFLSFDNSPELSNSLAPRSSPSRVDSDKLDRRVHTFDCPAPEDSNRESSPAVSCHSHRSMTPEYNCIRDGTGSGQGVYSYNVDGLRFSNSQPSELGLSTPTSPLKGGHDPHWRTRVLEALDSFTRQNEDMLAQIHDNREVISTLKELIPSF